jgi:hypothetical protein
MVDALDEALARNSFDALDALDALRRRVAGSALDPIVERIAACLADLDYGGARGELRRLRERLAASAI